MEKRVPIIGRKTNDEYSAPHSSTARTTQQPPNAQADAYGYIERDSREVGVTGRDWLVGWLADWLYRTELGLVSL